MSTHNFSIVTKCKQMNLCMSWVVLTIWVKNFRRKLTIDRMVSYILKTRSANKNWYIDVANSPAVQIWLYLIFHSCIQRHSILQISSEADMSNFDIISTSSSSSPSSDESCREADETSSTTEDDVWRYFWLSFTTERYSGGDINNSIVWSMKQLLISFTTHAMTSQ